MSNSKDKKENLYKILLLGDWSVGKTCFLMRYIDNTFNEIHLSTIGMDYKLKDVTLENGKTVKIQIWDTAGQERYKSISKSYVKGANGIFLIYDITNKASFEGIRNWVKQIKEQVSPRVCVALVANKIDDKEKEEVSSEDGIKLSNEIKFPFYQVSAKEGIGVNECFDELIKQIVKNYESAPMESGQKLNNQKNQGQASKCCQTCFNLIFVIKLK